MIMYSTQVIFISTLGIHSLLSRIYIQQTTKQKRRKKKLYKMKVIDLHHDERGKTKHTDSAGDGELK
jgi:hypothetical protein